MTIQTTGPKPGYDVAKDGPAGEVLYSVSVRIERTTPALKAAIRSAGERLEAADERFGRDLRAAEDAGNYETMDLPATDDRRRRYDRYMRFSAKAALMRDMLAALLAVPDGTELSPYQSEPWVQVERFCRAVEELAVFAGLTDPNQ